MNSNQKLKQLIREVLTSLIENRQQVSKSEAKSTYDKLKLSCDFNEFLMGMNVELEHQDITHGDLIMTAKIALAHLKEMPDYYTKLKKYVESGVKNEDGGFTYDDGSGERQKYSDQDSISGGMGTMMS